MKPIPAMRVVTATGAQVLGRPPFGAFTSVSTDTRSLEPGALFIALRGEKFDGHRFLSTAESSGALAAIVDARGIAENPCGLPVYIVPDTLKAYGDLAASYRRQFDIPVVGITGTVGKTTTKDFTAAVLETQRIVVATEGNFNNEIGVPQTLMRATDDTGALVLEMGMRGPGQIARLAQIAEPTCGVITAIGKTHSEFFPNGEAGVARAKAELLDALPTGEPVALCADSPWLESTLRPHAKGPVTTFGMSPDADVRAEDYRLVDGRASFRVVTHEGAQDVLLASPGSHLAINATAALCVALWHGVPLESAARALESVKLGKHRLQSYTSSRGWTVVDDSYNAGPSSVRAALDVLRQWPAVRRIAVLGDMRELGPDTEQEHSSLGAEVATAADVLVTVGGLARLIGETGCVKDWLKADNAEEAVRMLFDELRPGDVVMVKGSRALELERVVEGLLR